MALPIALQLYSVRDYTSKDFRGTLQAVKDMGYDGVELAGIADYTATEIKAMVDEIGLVPISAHVSINELMKDTEGTIAKYVEIGCSYIAIPALPTEIRPEGGDFSLAIKEIAKIAKEAKKQDIQLLYHNHEFEFVLLDGKYALDLLYEEIPSELLQTEIDTCWVKVAGVDPAEYVKKYTGRAPLVHLKDFTGTKVKPKSSTPEAKKEAAEKSDFEFRPLGKGVQDIPSILDAANAAGSKWLVVEMDSPCCNITSMECSIKSRDYLRTLGY